MLGTLQDPFLANQLMLAYFADNGKEISPKVSCICCAPAEADLFPRHSR